MFELLEQILNSLDFFTDGIGSDSTDAVHHITEFEPEVFAISLLGDDNGKSGSEKPKGDSEICKKLTNQVIEMQKTRH